MTTEWWVIPVVLVAAHAHITWNAFVKSSADRFFTMTTLMGGLFLGLANSLAMFVMSFSGMASVAALRATSVLLAVTIGAIKLQETFGLYRWSAAAVVTSCIFVMQFGS